MKVTRDPQQYGETAERGIFISIEEIKLLPDFMRKLERQIIVEQLRAAKKYEYYNDIHEGGEATTAQCNMMDKYYDKNRALCAIVEKFKDCEKEIEKIKRYESKGTD